MCRRLFSGLLSNEFMRIKMRHLIQNGHTSHQADSQIPLHHHHHHHHPGVERERERDRRLLVQVQEYGGGVWLTAEVETCEDNSSARCTVSAPTNIYGIYDLLPDRSFHPLLRQHWKSEPTVADAKTTKQRSSICYVLSINFSYKNHIDLKLLNGNY